MTTPNSLIAIVDKVLPALSNKCLTYNKENCIFLTDGYTSVAGNTYYQGIRLSDRIMVSYDLGEGYAYTFLNGVRVYAFNGHEKKLIGTRDFSCYVFTENRAKSAAISIVNDFLKGEMKLLGGGASEYELKDFSVALVNETYRRMKMIG